MKTRSQGPTDIYQQPDQPPCEHPLYEVNIDFDEASRAWRENKKSMKNGQFIYTCTKCKRITKKGHPMCYLHLKESHQN